ncbi:MAG: type II toxin-antitoxin system HicB family antitoxin, partial [Dehalococcoidia bacterium]
ADALAMLQEAMAAWLEATLADGDPIPPPLDDAGTVDLHLRVPFTLYRHLSDRACVEGRNLADMASGLLTDALAARRGQS